MSIASPKLKKRYSFSTASLYVSNIYANLGNIFIFTYFYINIFYLQSSVNVNITEIKLKEAGIMKKYHIGH